MELGKQHAFGTFCCCPPGPIGLPRSAPPSVSADLLTPELDRLGRVTSSARPTASPGISVGSATRGSVLSAKVLHPSRRRSHGYPFPPRPTASEPFSRSRRRRAWDHLDPRWSRGHHRRLARTGIAKCAHTSFVERRSWRGGVILCCRSGNGSPRIWLDHGQVRASPRLLRDIDRLPYGGAPWPGTSGVSPSFG
jgi:hypothetical protein